MSEGERFPLGVWMKQIAPRLPSKEQRERLQTLLERVERGDIEAEFDLDDAVQQLPSTAQDWLREKYQGYLQKQRGMELLPGQISILPASQRWVCQKGDCGEDEPVLQEGEEPPECPRHHRKMIRADRRTGDAG